MFHPTKEEPQEQMFCVMEVGKMSEDLWTYRMNRGSNVYMDPDSRPVKTDVRSNEEPSTGAWTIVSILQKQ